MAFAAVKSRPVVLNEVAMGHLDMSRVILGCDKIAEQVWLVRGGQRPEILVNLQQRAGQLRTAKNYRAQNVKSGH